MNTRWAEFSAMQEVMFYIPNADTVICLRWLQEDWTHWLASAKTCLYCLQNRNFIQNIKAKSQLQKAIPLSVAILTQNLILLFFFFIKR